MKRNIFYTAAILFVLLAITAPVKSQVAINTDGTLPHSSAMLDVKSTDKGILIPRLTAAQMTLIASPSDGLLIYNSDEKVFYFRSGTTWTKLATGNTTSQWTTTVSGTSIYYTSTGGVGIGNTNPNSRSILDLTSSTKGFLVPRMSQSQRTSISSPPQGLLVFQTDGTSGFYYNNNGWRYLFNSISTLISVPQGGTGLSSVNSGEIIYGNDANSLSSSSNLTFDGNTLFLNAGFKHNGGNYSSVTTETDDIEIDNTHNIVLCNGTFSVYLPLASENNGRLLTIKNIGTGSITVIPSNFEPIDGGTNYTLITKKSIIITCNGSGWFIIGGF